MQDIKTTAEQQYEEFRATDHGKSFFIPTTLFHESGISHLACGPDDRQCGVNIRPTPAQETKYWIGIHRCNVHADKQEQNKREFNRLRSFEQKVRKLFAPLLEALG
jgi:hypothetical protein